MTARTAIPALAALLAASAATAAGAQRGDETAAGAAWRASVAPIAGALVPDGDLADYRWDTSPSLQAGLRAAVHRSWLAAGVQTVWAGTSQATGIPGETTVPRVNITEVDFVLEARAARVRGLELWTSGHAGRLFLGYDPDQLTVDVGGLSEPITVDYAPIDEWCFGFGIEFRHALARHLALGLQLKQTTFELDTAHRRGNEIVESRERFWGWSLSLALLGFADLNRASSETKGP